MTVSKDGEQIGLAAEMTAAWLSNPHTRAQADDASAMLGSVHAALVGLTSRAPTPAAELSSDAPRAEAAVSVRRSLASPDHIISMIDGKPYRSLGRHIRAHGLTPDEYRQRYGLKPDYPMTAPSYSAARSAAAKQHNFGRKPTGAAAPEQAAAQTSSTDTPGGRRRLSRSL